MNEKPAWVDSHCHLEMLKEPVAVAMEKSRSAGMLYCITIGTSHKANLQISQFCNSFSDVFGTLGFHPHGASKVKESDFDWIKKEIANNKKIVAVGECGFDLYYEYSKKEDQADVFQTQVELAIELDMPIVIHSRDADADTRDVIDSFNGNSLKGVVHCFSSDIPQARYFLDRGFYLSFNGISTFPQAKQVRDVILYTPRDRILLETDAPYLSPVPFRGKPNLPGRVSIVGEFISELLDLPVPAFSNQIQENTETLFERIRL